MIQDQNCETREQSSWSTVVVHSRDNEEACRFGPQNNAITKPALIFPGDGGAGKLSPNKFSDQPKMLCTEF